MTEMSPSRRYSTGKALKKACGLLVLVCMGSAGAQNATPVANALPTLTLPAAPAAQAWHQLTSQQKLALAPLGAQWSALTPQQQSKWLAISHNFAQMSVAEQITMHDRMSDWVALSPQQRNLARLNFNKLQALPKEDKKAKWEAYQALPTEEKRLLSSGSPPPPKSAAPTAKPLAPHRVVQTPIPSAAQKSSPSPEINRKTLLPKAPAMAAPAAPLAPAPVTDVNRPSTEITPS